MKRSELKEAIKAEITSVLSEEMSPEEVKQKMDQAMRGGAKAEPLAKLATIGQKKKTVRIKGNSQEYKVEKVMANGDILISRDGKNVGTYRPNQLEPVKEDLNEISSREANAQLEEIEEYQKSIARLVTQDLKNEPDVDAFIRLVLNDVNRTLTRVKNLKKFKGFQLTFSDIREDEDEDDKAASKNAKKEKIGKQASKLSQADEDRYERIKNGLEKLKKKGDEESIKRMKAILGKKDVQKLIKAKGREESSFM